MAKKTVELLMAWLVCQVCIFDEMDLDELDPANCGASLVYVPN